MPAFQEAGMTQAESSMAPADVARELCRCAAEPARIAAAGRVAGATAAPPIVPATGQRDGTALPLDGDAFC
jgi:hypothetical protein